MKASAAVLCSLWFDQQMVIRLLICHHRVTQSEPLPPQHHSAAAGQTPAWIQEQEGWCSTLFKYIYKSLYPHVSCLQWEGWSFVHEDERGLFQLGWWNEPEWKKLQNRSWKNITHICQRAAAAAAEPTKRLTDAVSCRGDATGGQEGGNDHASKFAFYVINHYFSEVAAWRSFLQVCVWNELKCIRVSQSFKIILASN